MANLKNLLVTGTGRFTDKVYASEFIGTITRALADGDGNTFQSTYSKATSLVNGSTFPSVRMISATAESNDYKLGSCAFAEGASTKANGAYSHAEGAGTTASGDYSHAEGASTTASGVHSHAEGSNTTASGPESHAEGAGTTASGNYSHAEGANTIASGAYSHAEGTGNTTASGEGSHAEGINAIASGSQSHAQGLNTKAGGNQAHAEGFFTIASSSQQHAQGKWNIEDTANKYAHIVGNGNGESVRSNAHTLDWNGNAWFKGSIYVGGTGQTDTAAVMVLPAKLVSTETTPTTNNTIYWLYE